MSELVRTLKQAAIWREGHLALLARGYVHRRRNAERGFTDRDHLRAAADWLGRAQDAAQDGGITGRYRLDRGWTTSYPETTGYAIPTLLALAEEFDDPSFERRAERCVRFLLPLQLPSGAFPALEIGENRTEPSFFNTAQIINGLLAWHRHGGDWRAQEAAARAGHWIASLQDRDGAFREATYMGVATAYAAHATCWIAELGQHLRDPRLCAVAERHLDWVLSARDPVTGFIDRMGFSAADHAARRAVTHTIGYTLFGLLVTAQIVGRDDAIESVRDSALRIARRLELSRRLPGVLDHRYRSAADYVCLTGNAQLAIVWMRLWQMESDGRLLNAAFKALDAVKDAQPMENENPAIRGGIPGSDPIDGGYIRLALPNWSAKFFIDALLLKRHVLATLRDRPRGATRGPGRAVLRLPERLPDAPPADAPRSSRAPAVVLYGTPRARKVARILGACAEFGFRPRAVVLEEGGAPPARARVLARLREDGMEPLLARFAPWNDTGVDMGGDAAHADSTGEDDPAALCADLGIPVLRVRSLGDESAVRAVAALRPDLAVCAGAGILRPAILAVPKLGTLNAHMGLLPHYRGMNVAEWSAFNGDPVGVTVHLVDAGIDTGDVLLARPLEGVHARTVLELRDAVDEAQLAVLGYVLRWILRHGTLPPRVPQARIEGPQWFTMHAELLAEVEADLRAAREAGTEEPGD